MQNDTSSFSAQLKTPLTAGFKEESSFSSQKGEDLRTNKSSSHSGERRKKTTYIGPVPERNATMFSCLANVIATMLGTGMLSLPYAMSAAGSVGGVIMFAVFQIISAYSFVCLAQACLMIPGSSFKDLAMASLPSKFSWIVDVEILLQGWGLCAGYFIVISTLMPQVAEALGGPDVNPIFLTRQFYSIAAATLSLPLCCLRSLDSLKFTSVLVFVFTLYLVFVVVYYWANPDDVEDRPIDLELEKFPAEPSEAVKVIALIANAFAAAQNVPSITNTLINPTPKRISYTFTISTFIVLVMYIVIGWAGAFTFGHEIDADVLRSYSPGLLPVTISRLCICLSLVGTIPIQLHPARKSFTMVFFDKSPDLDSRLFYFSTAILFSTGCFVSLVCDDLGTFLTFLGALTAVPITFIFPAWFYIRVSQKKAEYHGSKPPRLFMARCVLALGFILVPVLMSIEFFTLGRTSSS